MSGKVGEVNGEFRKFESSIREVEKLSDAFNDEEAADGSVGHKKEERQQMGRFHYR